MLKFFKQIKYFFGTIYRGLIGRYHNAFDKTPEINKEVENFVIGKSSEGREIRCYKVISNKVISNKLLIVAGIHGNEVGTVKLAHHIINFCRDAIYDVSKNTKDAMNRVSTTVYVIPCLNPDGYHQALKNHDYAHRGQVGRFNSKGVDLNRNFPSKNWQQKSTWGFGTNYNDTHVEVFCGEFGGSELETQALINFIKSENIENLIMLHNAGKDVVVYNDDAITKNWAEIYHKFTGFKIKINYNQYTGDASDFARENNIHYMTVEGSSRWGSDWKKQKKAIEKIISNMAIEQYL